MQTVTQSETYQNEIGGLDQHISMAESKLTPEAMETTIENSEALSEVRQTADKINWIVESGTSSSNMTLTDDALNVISEGITLTADKTNLVADDINLTGNASVNTIVSEAIDPITDEIDSLGTRMDQAETSITQNAQAIELRATKEEVEKAQNAADFAKPYISDTPPTQAPDEGKLWIDEGVTPSVWRKWRGANVPTDRVYEDTVAGDSSITLDNPKGQIQSVEVLVKCVAKQEGTGDPSPSNVRTIEGYENINIETSDVGEGTITPSSSLYGLQNAEDTVDVSVDGDVLVTRRTKKIVFDGTENWAVQETGTGSGTYRMVYTQSTFDGVLPASNGDVIN